MSLSHDHKYHMIVEHYSKSSAIISMLPLNSSSSHEIPEPRPYLNTWYSTTWDRSQKEVPKNGRIKNRKTWISRWRSIITEKEPHHSSYLNNPYPKMGSLSKRYITYDRSQRDVVISKMSQTDFHPTQAENHGKRAVPPPPSKLDYSWKKSGHSILRS